MTNLRDLKRQARKDLHQHMQIPALYLVPAPAGSSSPYEAPLFVTVRLHLKFDAIGDMKGTNFHYAERHEPTPKIIFMRSEVNKPVRNAVIVIEAGEAYRVDNVLPPDDITVAAEVLRLSAAEASGLPVPDGTQTPADTCDGGGYYTDDNFNVPYVPEDTP